jgi:hypothetical protein
MTKNESARLRRYEKRMGFAIGKDRVSVRAFPFSSVVVDPKELARDYRDMGKGKRWLTIPLDDGDD